MAFPDLAQIWNKNGSYASVRQRLEHLAPDLDAPSQILLNVKAQEVEAEALLGNSLFWKSQLLQSLVAFFVVSTYL